MNNVTQCFKENRWMCSGFIWRRIENSKPVNPVMNFLVPQNVKNFVTSQASSNVLNDGLRSSDSISKSNPHINCYITYTFLLLCLFHVYGT